MRKGAPFLFNMSALAAWPLAYVLGIALLVGLLIIFGGGAYDSQVYVAALFGPVGLTPLIARWKGMSTIRWTIGAAVMSIVQIAAPVIFLHPVTVLLAIVFHQPPAPAASPPPPPGAEQGEAEAPAPIPARLSAPRAGPRPRRTFRKRRR